MSPSIARNSRDDAFDPGAPPVIARTHERRAPRPAFRVDTEPTNSIIGSTLAVAALRLVSPVEEVPTPAGVEAESLPLFDLVPPGRLVELSAVPHGPSARTSTAVALLREVQREGETTAWVQPAGGQLYPPDLHDAGVDLAALVVVHVPEAEGAAGLGKASELLLRSEAFGLVVVDLGSLPSRTAWHGRILGLARQHHSRVVLLTDKPTADDSLGTLVGLRVEPRREATSHGGFHVEHRVLKNKSGAPVVPAVDRFVGPPGLR